MTAKPHASSIGPELAVEHWAAEKGYIRMMVRDFVTEVRVGIHAWERHPERPQRVVINMDLYAEDPKSAHREGLSSVVDYDYICGHLRTWPSKPQVDFIETLLEELVELSFRDARVKACRVSIMKPDIFNDAAGAGVEIYRVR
jgi:dihydroneopterin aldolase